MNTKEIVNMQKTPVKSYNQVEAEAVITSMQRTHDELVEKYKTMEAGSLTAIANLQNDLASANAINEQLRGENDKLSAERAIAQFKVNELTKLVKHLAEYYTADITYKGPLSTQLEGVLKK